MGIKRIVCLVLCAAASLANVWATPATSIALKYDMDKQVLHVSAAHPTDRMERYFVRRIEVYINDVQATAVNLPRQKMPSGIEEDINVKANYSDKIAVDLFSSEGGKGSAAITLPPPPKKEEKEEKKK